MPNTDPTQHNYPGLIDILVRNAGKYPKRTEAEALAQMGRLLQHAYDHVPLYRELWSGCGFDPREFKSPSDLTRLPMVDKEIIVEAGDAAMDQRLVGSEFDTMSTSGTSGRAITISRTRRELRVVRRSFLRALLRNGIRPWHRTVTFASTWLSSKRGTIVSKIAKVRHIKPTDSLDHQINVLKSFPAHNLIGQTGGLYLLARELLRRGLTHKLRSLVPTGATLMPEMRQVMRDAFLAEPRDLYGAVELGTVSWQGPCGQYHLDADRMHVEIVNDAGQPVPHGQTGQVVCTSLYGTTVPLIRYRLLDVASFTRETCNCGIKFPLMGPVRGRINDFLPTKKGDLVSPHYLYHIFDGVGGSPVKEWRIIQHSLDEMTYEYVPEEPFNSDAFKGGMNVIRERFSSSRRSR
ncbi:MAG: phenylacetate--CoA ligase family protein [Planctomycetota bacterium]|jgi:phenylacetate-CoA ligase